MDLTWRQKKNTKCKKTTRAKKKPLGTEIHNLWDINSDGQNAVIGPRLPGEDYAVFFQINNIAKGPINNLEETDSRDPLLLRSKEGIIMVEFVGLCRWVIKLWS